MHRRFDQQLLILLSLMTAVLGLFFVASTRSLTLGLGFGRESTVIIETWTADVSGRLLESDFAQRHDFEVRQLDANTYLINASRVESIDSLRKSINTALPNTNIRLIGSFGSSTKLENTQSFVTMSILAIFVLMSVYLIYRFRYFGWMAALLLVLAGTLSFWLSSLFAYSFTMLLWLSILVLLLYTSTLCVNFFHHFLEQSLYHLAQDLKTLKQVIIRFSLLTLPLLVLGLLFYLLFDRQFHGPALVLWIHFAVINLALWGFYTICYRFIYDSKELEEGLAFLVFENQRLINLQSPADLSYRWVSRFFLLVLLVLGITLAATRPGLEWEQIYTEENLVILKSASFDHVAELNADFIHYDVFNNQVRHEVSEQNNTWIYFSRHVDRINLNGAISSFSERTEVEVETYHLPAQTVSFIQFNFLFSLLMILALYLVINSGLRSLAHGINTALYLIFALVYIMILVLVTHLEMGNLIILLMYLLLILIPGDLGTMPEDLSKQETYSALFIHNWVLHFIFMAILLLPIVIIVPLQISSGIVLLLAFSFLASIMAGISLGFIKERLK